MIPDYLLWDMIEPPVIPFDLTPEEINGCKQMAYRKLISLYPVLNDVDMRRKLSPLDKVSVVNAMSTLFERYSREAVKNKQ